MTFGTLLIAVVGYGAALLCASAALFMLIFQIIEGEFGAAINFIFWSSTSLLFDAITNWLVG